MDKAMEGLEERINVLNKRVDLCKHMQEMQMMQIPFVNGDGGAYVIGVYNGMEMMLSIMEDRRPEFAGIPMESVDDVTADYKEPDGEEVERTISGLVKGHIGPCMGAHGEGKEGERGCLSMI